MPNIVRTILVLSKLKIVLLLVFVAVGGMCKAAGGLPSWPALLAIIIGGTFAAAGANSINQGLDSDIDSVMPRTRKRPVPSQQMTKRATIYLGVTGIALAVLIIGTVTNWVAASLTLCAALIYVFLYTMFMKRRSWNNIVIGGAAGALPPLIGAVAVIGEVEVIGLYMFAMVFFWTPPHFWALSLKLKDDYAAASVPMLPVIAGERGTGIQILTYIILLGFLAWVPYAAGFSGLTYPIVASLLTLGWMRKSVPLLGANSQDHALSSYKFSLLYLFGLFLLLGLDPILP